MHFAHTRKSGRINVLLKKKRLCAEDLYKHNNVTVDLFRLFHTHHLSDEKKKRLQIERHPFVLVQPRDERAKRQWTRFGVVRTISYLDDERLLAWLMMSEQMHNAFCGRLGQ